MPVHARALCQPVLGISMREARSSVLCVTVSARCVGRDRKRERDRDCVFGFSMRALILLLALGPTGSTADKTGGKIRPPAPRSTRLP